MSGSRPDAAFGTDGTHTKVRCVDRLRQHPIHNSRMMKSRCQGNDKVVRCDEEVHVINDKEPQQKHRCSDSCFDRDSCLCVRSYLLFDPSTARAHARVHKTGACRKPKSLNHTLHPKRASWERWICTVKANGLQARFWHPVSSSFVCTLRRAHFLASYGPESPSCWKRAVSAVVTSRQTDHCSRLVEITFALT